MDEQAGPPPGKTPSDIPDKWVTAGARALCKAGLVSNAGYIDGDEERAAEAVLKAAAALPPVDGEPLTHFFHCWRFPAHHACAIALIERQATENDTLLVRAAEAERKSTQDTRAHVAEQDAVHADLSQLLRVLGLGDHARPQSPHEVMLDAINEVGRLRAHEHMTVVTRGIDAFLDRMADSLKAHAEQPLEVRDIATSLRYKAAALRGTR